MSSPLRWLAAFVLVLSATTPVWADACFHPRNLFVAAESPWERHERLAPTSPECDFVIVRDPSVKDAELRIPRRLMLADAAAPGSTRTAMVGLALSAACVGGGLWCLRFRPREIPKKKLMIGAALAAVLIVALTLVSFPEANGHETPTRIMVPTVRLGDIAVNVRIVDEGDAMELVVPPELADKIAAR